MTEINYNNLPEAVTQLFNKLDNIEKLLNSQSANQSEGDQLLTIQEAGELIKLSVPTIYGYVSRSEIPFSKKGKRLYFSKKELFDWVQQGRKQTLAEIDKETNTYLKKGRSKK